MKQTGGRGQYGHVVIEIEPKEDGGYEFENGIVGGVIPKEYIPAVDKGIQNAMKRWNFSGLKKTHGTEKAHRSGGSVGNNTEPGKVMRHIKRGGKVWIRIFPDRVITSKPAEVRQGKGKGAPSGWYAAVKPGRVLYEIKGVDMETAKEALTRAMHKLPIKTKIVAKEVA